MVFPVKAEANINLKGDFTLRVSRDMIFRTSTKKNKTN